AGFAVIRSDEVRKELRAESGLDGSSARANRELYTEEWNDRTYHECLRRAEPILFEGGRVLIDASFQNESRRPLVLDARLRWGVRTGLIVCEADADTIRQRLAHRRGDASDADWSIHEAIARRWEPMTSETLALSRHLDTGGTPETAAHGALEILRE